MFSFNNKEKIIFTFIIFLHIVSTASEDDQSTFNKNVTCEKIQSSEFPEDLFTKTQRKCGAIILHVIFAIHCFGAIAIVCRERFLPTINCICEDLKLSDDVAAATFMSLATSAPELFSNIIGTFITESDIGIGHVIGNGYYNMFFVAALGGLVATKEIVLEWWPLARDCGIYGLVALVLTAIVWDGVVQTYETVILLLLYFLYFFIMFNNKKILNTVYKKINTEATNEASKNEVIEVNEKAAEAERGPRERMHSEEAESLYSEEQFTLPPAPVPPAPKVLTMTAADKVVETSTSMYNLTTRWYSQITENERWKMTKKIFTTPINFLMSYTIPDVRVNKYKKYYPLAFLICVIWIGVSTYFGTWMVSVIGETLGISDLVMGMVFMAAGGSVVEAYSVYYKAKRGECSIGLSNSIGCNTLDATLCLALPWFIKTLPIRSSPCKDSSSTVVLESSLIHINCLLLFISVIALYVIFYINKFKLNKRLGLICGGMYAFVLFVGISVESYSTNE